MGYELKDVFNDQMLAILGVITVCCIIAAVLLEKYLPLEPETPPITRSDDAIEKMTKEQLMALDERDENLPWMTLETLADHSGLKGQKAYVCCKGVIYDCSKNEVYLANASYNVFAGKDATLALGKMLFELSGKRGWRKLLDHEELCTLWEWQKWYNQRYEKVAYLVEEYAYNERNEEAREKEQVEAAAEAKKTLDSIE